MQNLLIANLLNRHYDNKYYHLPTEDHIMLKGYTLPRTPNGSSSLAPTPPWHYAGNCLAVEYEGNPEAIKSLLPDGLQYTNNRCAVYFVEWQFCTDDGKEYLDPVRSQYKETIFMISAELRNELYSYCPFIWVDQDISLMRGLAQGWPKQIGSTWMTRAYDLPSKATPSVAPGGQFGASLSARDRRLAEARITLEDKTDKLPNPSFAKALNVRYFPDLVKGNHDKPLVNQLVQLKSRDIQISPVWKGSAELTIFENPYIELHLLRPVNVTAGYKFSFALTVDDLIPL